MLSPDVVREINFDQEAGDVTPARPRGKQRTKPHRSEKSDNVVNGGTGMTEAEELLERLKRL